jgi:hypothetical protein
LNKIISTKKTSAIFLATILVLGTFALSSPSFMAGAQADTYYGMDSYDKSYGKDNSYKSKDSNSVSIKKIKCNNINVNVNGLEIDGLPPALSTLLTDGEADEGERGSSYYGSASGGSYGDGQSGSDKDFKFICINNNNNTVIGIDEDGVGVTPPPPPGPTITCEECFTTNLNETQLDSLLSILPAIEFENLESFCEFLSNSTIPNDNRLFALLVVLGAIEGITDEDFLAVFECLVELGLITLPDNVVTIPLGR